jgi:hypothetical protein
MIQRSKNNTRNGDTVVPRVQRRCWRLIFSDRDGILLVDYLEKGSIIMAKYYVALLNKLKQQLVLKCQGKLSKGILFLQDNVAPH